MPCIFCEGALAPLTVAHLSGASCVNCPPRLGRLIFDRPELMVGLFPGLIDEAEDEIAPEPRVRLADGRSVELREHTAELKKSLTPAQRAELAGSYVELELWREATLEAAQALCEGVTEKDAEAALGVLFHPRIALPTAAVAVRGLLFPQ